ncbi:unnamed protein product [Trypanosoma congolense IL3000]|uniref:WGS project CAEQ00000000 data, annotated contig 1193 n=1 Tax=Trypanosoma congolense (strain IL3000) TaxID=1068625 RepID=F9W4K4_TRYCI|nr:unnamed protein product [Trypanosoma congolense IL3000]
MTQNSAESDTMSCLPWVKYEDVYYAAIIVPAEEAPRDVPSGHQFGYFPGSESASVVPLADVEPFDTANEERMNNPAAAEGVLVAKQLIMGAEGATSGDAEGLEDEEEWSAMPIKAEDRRKQSRSKDQREVARRKGTKGLSLARPRQKKSRKAISHDNEEDDGDSFTEGASSSSGSGASTVSISDNEEEDSDQQAHWRHMEKDLGAVKTSTRGKRGLTQPGHTSHSGARAKNYLGIFDTPIGSPAAPFLAEIHHHYHRILAEAAAKGCVVNMQESEVVRAVEVKVLAVRSEIMHLKQLLQNVEEENKGHPESSEVIAIRNRVREMENDFNVEEFVKQQVRIQEVPAKNSERRRNAGLTNLYSFVDASMGYLLDVAAPHALPRESSYKLLQVYREQRNRRDKLIEVHQGLGKLGLMVPKTRVMEKWRRSRELMVLEPMREKQPASRRFSETLAKVDRHAMKRLNASYDAKGATTQLQQRRPVVIYNFHSLQNEGEKQDEAIRDDKGLFPNYHLGLDESLIASGVDNMENPEAAPTQLQAPLISPLQTNFDPREVFASGANQNLLEGLNSEMYGVDSVQYSQSLRLPSQETMWERSEMHDGASQIHQHRRMQRSARSSRAVSMSRASSRASSVMREASIATSRRRARSIASSVRGDHRTPNDWRGSAKRVILEQLTLYLRGIRGKPAVLREEDFSKTAKKLLERAVSRESERKGISMSLQANNASIPFTKDAEARLRKSVDSYVQRYFIANQAHSTKQGINDDTDNNGGMRYGVTQRRDDEDETRSVTVARNRATDSPVYDQ